jgi:hypothetical protein
MYESRSTRFKPLPAVEAAAWTEAFAAGDRSRPAAAALRPPAVSIGAGCAASVPALRGVLVQCRVRKGAPAEPHGRQDFAYSRLVPSSLLALLDDITSVLDDVVSAERSLDPIAVRQRAAASAHAMAAARCTEPGSCALMSPRACRARRPYAARDPDPPQK